MHGNTQHQHISLFCTHTHTQIFDPADITDSSSTHSDDTTSGGCGGGTESCSGRTSRGARLSGEHASSTRRRKNALNAKERNLRRLESNERERMRMHSLNDAFQVSAVTRVCVYGICRGTECRARRPSPPPHTFPYPPPQPGRSITGPPREGAAGGGGGLVCSRLRMKFAFCANCSALQGFIQPLCPATQTRHARKTHRIAISRAVAADRV